MHCELFTELHEVFTPAEVSAELIHQQRVQPSLACQLPLPPFKCGALSTSFSYLLPYCSCVRARSSSLTSLPVASEHLIWVPLTKLSVVRSSDVGCSCAGTRTPLAQGVAGRDCVCYAWQTRYGKVLQRLKLKPR